MELKMQPGEAEVIKRILTEHLSDLYMEISNTEDYDLRQQLKQEEVILKSVIDRMEQAGRMAA